MGSIETPVTPDTGEKSKETDKENENEVVESPKKLTPEVPTKDES
jgi:hypothetical protein